MVSRGRKGVLALVGLLGAGVLLTACWLPRLAPLPGTRIFQSNFFGLACPSANFCVAAGTFAQPPIDSGQPLPFFDVLASDHWTSVRPPLPSDADGTVANITAVACISPGTCIAVGNYEVSPGDTQGLIESFTNGSWTAVQAPLPSDASTQEQGVVLTSVSCGTDGTCAAIGQYLEPNIRTPSALIETLSGGTWSATVPPLPSDAGTPQIFTMLSAVSCASASACAVIGDYLGTSYGALIETLSSGQWVAIDAPSANGVGGASLNAVSCIASGICTVVGSDAGSGPSTSRGLIDTLSGGNWTALPAPVPSDGDGIVGFTSVSCASDDTCAAIGDYHNGARLYVPFADSLVSGTWTASVIPLPADATNSNDVPFPGPVSCSWGLHCTAVGSYNNALGDARDFAYIATTSGGTWSSLTAPLPPASSAISSWLSVISCPSSVLCFGFGGYETIAGATQIIETGFNLKLPGSSLRQIEASGPLTR